MDLGQPGDELVFYRKDMIDLTQRGAEAITSERENIGDWIGIPVVFIFHLIHIKLLWYKTLWHTLFIIY